MITCRAATQEDTDEMGRIRDAGGWTGGASAAWMARYLAGLHHPRHALAPRIAYVAEESGHMIGFVAGHRTTRFACDGEVQWLFVLPERRGGSVARLLLGQLAAWFVHQGVRRVCVNVEPENTRARRFYARCGAEVLAEHWLVWRDVSSACAPAGDTPPSA